MSKQLTYRPSVAGIIFDKDHRFLLVQLVEARENEFDFVKGGMQDEETKEQTLQREILEELGANFQYKIMEQSHWYIVYDWPKELQERKGFIGQARTSFWVKYLGGGIKLDNDELKSYQWINEEDLESVLLKSGFPKILVQNLVNEWLLNRNILLND
jgi:8-oxo-dGTP pyrophosphatase MutT (NUDIX family)